MKPTIRIGTRKSALAKVQSQQVLEALEAQGLSGRLVEIVSSGDRDTTTPLYEMGGGSGLFTKQLEAALLSGSIDLAVHSLKDLPTRQPADLKIASVPTRVVAEDCLLVRAEGAAPMHEGLRLKVGARVGTSSLRREAQLRSVRPDLIVESLRGNVPTRVEAVRRGRIDGVVLAEAGLFRLGLDLTGLIRQTLPAEKFVSAPGQGALALEVHRSVSPELWEACQKLQDEATAQETRVERAILQALEGGCSLPLGVRCRRLNGGLQLFAFLGVARELSDGRRDWISFHHFDICDPRAETLVEKTVDYFRPFLTW